MEREEREEMIRNYIDGYNKFDVNKMVADFADEVFLKISRKPDNIVPVRITSVSRAS